MGRALQLAGPPLDDYGDTPLADLENMTDELAGFAASLPDRFRYSVMSALRQACEAGVRYGYMTQNPAKLAGANPMPPPRAVRVYTPEGARGSSARSSTARGAAAVTFAAATGLRPAEWANVERRDVDRTRRVLTVRGTKTQRSRREVPLTVSGTRRARLAASPASTPLRLRRARRVDRSTSTTSGGASGGQRSRRQGSRSRRGCTTSARRSPRTRSRQGSRSTSSPGSWARASG